MRRGRGRTEDEEYFAAGVRLVWIIDPRARTAEVFTGKTQSTLLREDDTLDGGEVLPGFSLPPRQLFAELELRPDDAIEHQEN